MAGTRNLQLGSVPEGSSLVPGTVMISKNVKVSLLFGAQGCQLFLRKVFRCSPWDLVLVCEETS